MVLVLKEPLRTRTSPMIKYRRVYIDNPDCPKCHGDGTVISEGVGNPDLMGNYTWVDCPLCWTFIKVEDKDE